MELPAGSTAADWVVTVVVRQPRAKPGGKAAVAVGPFAVLDVLRQTGTVRVTAGPYTRFVFKHGPDLRRTDTAGQPDDDNTIALFRLGTGPTGTAATDTPLLTVEAWPLEGAVRVTPVYTLKLTDAGWRVEARVHRHAGSHRGGRAYDPGAGRLAWAGIRIRPGGSGWHDAGEGGWRLAAGHGASGRRLQEAV